jgi:hypothetical protein
MGGQQILVGRQGDADQRGGEHLECLGDLVEPDQGPYLMAWR